MKTVFFGAAVEGNPVAGIEPPDAGIQERLILLGAILLVVAAILTGVALARRRRRHHKSRGEYRRHSSFAKNAVKGVAEIKQYVVERKAHSSRRRHRRREHRPRNPTLAETGGLPPIRAEASPPPPLNPPS